MLAVSPPSAAMPRAARRAVIVFFMLHGLLVASWIVRIPDVKAHLGLSDGALGLALLGPPAGAVAGQVLVGWLLGVYGSKTISVSMAVAWCLLFPLLGLAPNLPALLTLLVLYGLVSGGLDVAMNAQATVVERRYGRPLLASFHGAWSVASLIAAGVGGVLAGRSVPVAPHFLAVALLVLAVVGVARRRLIADEGAPMADARRPVALLPRALVPLGLLALCALLFEGAVTNWAAVYLRDILGSPPTEAAAAYVAFTLTMTVARLTGDRLTLRLGPAAVVRGGGLLALAGLLVFLLSPLPLGVILGCALIGAGLACVLPVTISAATRTTAAAPGRAISALVTVGYAGDLLGPPLVGAVAQLVSLRGALSLLGLAALTLLFLGGRVQVPLPSSPTSVGDA